MTVKQHILYFLQTHSGFVSGSEIENQARDWQSKASVISRRCREMVKAGLIERRLNDRRAVEYRYIRIFDNNSTWKQRLDANKELKQEQLI